MPNAIYLYRMARWLYLHHIPLLPLLLQLTIFIVYNCRISYKGEIGKGTFLSHGGLGVTISPKSKIGKNCVLGYRCSIVGQKPFIRTPEIGDNVYISPGAVLQGPIIVEHDAVIAANAVVNKSVPAYAIVGGIPAKIIGDVRELGYDMLHGEANDDSVREFLEWKKK